MNSLEVELQKRRISEVLHFTTNKGLLGVLSTKYILSRERVTKEQILKYILKPNSNTRKDSEWIDYVNLSISRINVDFLKSSRKWHQNDDVWWAVLSFAPEIILSPGVVFTTTNNIYTGVCRSEGLKGFQNMFGENICRWQGKMVKRDMNMPISFTTCIQAEVLYPEKLSTTHLRKIYVGSNDHREDVIGMLSAVDHDIVEVVVDGDVFLGVKNE